jgi:hypothetical protein
MGIPQPRLHSISPCSLSLAERPVVEQDTCQAGSQQPAYGRRRRRSRRRPEPRHHPHDIVVLCFYYYFFFFLRWAGVGLIQHPWSGIAASKPHTNRGFCTMAGRRIDNSVWVVIAFMGDDGCDGCAAEP